MMIQEGITMNKPNCNFNMFFTTVLIIGWVGIIFVSFLLYLVSDMFKFLGNGILVYITVGIYILSFVLPIVFKKWISKYFSLPLSFVLFTILSVVFVGCILGGAKSYISNFSQEKWNNNERLRIYMIDDLEEDYVIVGMTNEEVLDLLGKPTYISDEQNSKYEYYVGESIIDPYGYQIDFENDIAVNTTLVEH